MTTPPSETKLSEALDEFDAAVWNRAHDTSSRATSRRVNARSSLESLYREQALENRRLLAAVSDYDDLTGEKARCEEYIVRLEKALDKAADDLSALRSLQLTEEEVSFLYGIPIAPGCTPECQSELDRICEKLRQGATK